MIKVPAAAAGTDSASFTGENYPDNSSVTGGTSFTKTWTIKNTGTNTWNSSYKLKYVSGGGLSVSQADIAISGTVAPGASYTFSVAMKTPAAQSSEKTYRDDWKFCNPSGASIIPLWVVIKVPAASAPSDDHGDDINTATSVNLNSSTAGVINRGGDWDYFRIVLPSAGTLTVYTAGSTDTYGILKNSSGTVVDANDDHNSSDKNFRISKDVAAGTYYVGVRHYNVNTGTGSYTFFASFFGVAPTDTIKPTFSVFSVSPSAAKLGSLISISYTVSDSGGSGLKQVELWRAADNGGIPGAWQQMETKTISGTGVNSNSGVFVDTPRAVNIYWYGAHVVDNAGNWNTEPSTKQVSVFKGNASDLFMWPIGDRTKDTDGHYSGAKEDITFWLDKSNENVYATWRDVQPFQRYYYIGDDGKHWGIHLGADYNLGTGDYEVNGGKDKSAVYPIADGTITGVYDRSDWGKVIFVRHDTSFGIYTSMYAHLDWIPNKEPKKGQSVNPLKPIAKVSNSGSGAKFAHLHFEIRRGDSVQKYSAPLGTGYVKDPRGEKYTKKCNGSDSNTNDCPMNQLDPNKFISKHN